MEQAGEELAGEVGITPNVEEIGEVTEEPERNNPRTPAPESTPTGGGEQPRIQYDYENNEVVLPEGVQRNENTGVLEVSGGEEADRAQEIANATERTEPMTQEEGDNAIEALLGRTAERQAAGEIPAPATAAPATEQNLNNIINEVNSWGPATPEEQAAAPSVGQILNEAQIEQELNNQE